MVTQEWGGEMGVAFHLSSAKSVDAFPRQHSRKAPAGSTLHAVADEGVPVSAIVGVIGRHLDLPVVAISPENAGEHFSFLAGFLALDSPASSVLTRERLRWQPMHPGLLADLDQGHSFTNER